MMLEELLSDVRKCLKSVWRYLFAVWRVSIRCQEDVRYVSERCLDDVWMVSGSCLEGF